MYIVIAEKEELKLVEELGYNCYPIIITGIGGVNVIRALKDLPRDAIILNIGYCGSNKFDIGTKISVTSVGTYHEQVQFDDSYKCDVFNIGYQQAKCYTSTDFITHTNIEELCVFDMELAFIRSMFTNTRSIKVVSDNLSLKEYKENKGE